MRNRFILLGIVLIVFLFLSGGALGQGVQEKEIRISPISIHWNADTRQFEAYFDVVNGTEETAELTSIIIFKRTDSRRHWRGAHLPALAAGRQQSFKLAFPPAIMLKAEFDSITVNIYGKDYEGLIDHSSRYLRIKSQPVVDDDKARVEITAIPTPRAKSEAETVKTLVELDADGQEVAGFSSQDFSCTLSPVEPEAEAESEKTVQTEAVPSTPQIMETPVSELLDRVEMSTLSGIEPVPELLVTISDAKEARVDQLKLSRELEVLDIGSRDKLLALYIAEGKSDVIAKALSDLHAREPENINHTLSLSRVRHEQGDIRGALDVLKSSLNRIYTSARIALNQVLNSGGKKQAAQGQAVSDETYLAREFNKLGLSLLEQKQYADAVSAFQSLNTLKQDYPLVHYHLGLGRLGLKQYHQAKQAFLKQSEAELPRNQQIDNLSSLTEVLAVTLEVPVIQTTKDQFQGLLPQVETPAETSRIQQQIALLDSLLVRVEEQRLASLPDLGIQLAKPFFLADVKPGQAVVVDFTITNSGKTASSPYQVNYQLKHEKGMVTDIPATDRFKPLAGNHASYVWNKQFTVPEDILPGTYRLVATIEQVDAAREVAYENNTFVSEPALAIVLPAPEPEPAVVVVAAPPVEEPKPLDLLSARTEALQAVPDMPAIEATKGEFHDLLKQTEDPEEIRRIRQNVMALNSLMVKVEVQQLGPLISRTEALQNEPDVAGIEATKQQFHGILRQTKTPEGIRRIRQNITILNALLDKEAEKQAAMRPAPDTREIKAPEPEQTTAENITPERPETVVAEQPPEPMVVEKATVVETVPGPVSAEQPVPEEAPARTGARMSAYILSILSIF
ncbi:hypothetical protein KKI24_22295 [bacterium]|nr:hypothetical protein [bacterium]